MDIYSANLLKQQSANSHVFPLGHIILIQSNQCLFLLFNVVYLEEKQQIPIL